MQRRYYGDHRYDVVMVDAGKFMACVERANDGYVIPKAYSWEKGLTERMHHIMNWHHGVPEMPIAHIEMKKVATGIWPFRKVVELPVVTFTNGRHRSRYMHYYSVKAFPVETNAGSAELLKE